MHALAVHDQLAAAEPPDDPVEDGRVEDVDSTRGGAAVAPHEGELDRPPVLLVVLQPQRLVYVPFVREARGRSARVAASKDSRVGGETDVPRDLRVLRAEARVDDATSSGWPSSMSSLPI